MINNIMGLVDTNPAPDAFSVSCGMCARAVHNWAQLKRLCSGAQPFVSGEPVTYKELQVLFDVQELFGHADISTKKGGGTVRFYRRPPGQVRYVISRRRFRGW